MNEFRTIPNKANSKESKTTFYNGRLFPAFEGEVLSWSLGLYFTTKEEQANFPRMRAVIRAMIEHRPDDLAQERRECIKSSFCDRMFGNNAKRMLAVIESELTR